MLISTHPQQFCSCSNASSYVSNSALWHISHCHLVLYFFVVCILLNTISYILLLIVAMMLTCIVVSSMICFLGCLIQYQSNQASNDENVYRILTNTTILSLSIIQHNPTLLIYKIVPSGVRPCP